MSNEEHIDIITQFFSKREPKDGFQELLTDLYRAIQCYRNYGTIEKFFEINPEMTMHREDIEALWEEFDALSPEELSEVALELLQEI